MGCCASEQDYKHSRASKKIVAVSTEFGWNLDQLQADSFTIDEANIRLNAEKRMPFRICSKYHFIDNSKFVIRARYVHFKGKGSFCFGLFHFENESKNEE